MAVFEVKKGTSPLILGLPHTGTFIPNDIYNNLNPIGQAREDTDWHIDRLYDGLLHDVTSVRALFHRYVIDANRDPSDMSLYPGMNTTSLVPLTNFDGKLIWTKEPVQDDIEQRKIHFHAPYHAALSAEITRIKELHGFAILYDCHSIRSHIPFLFEGQLPDFNIGTNEGTTCNAELEQAALNVLKKTPEYSHILNGRFKGGWTTRHYGAPNNKVYAIQMELAQSTHLTMEAPPFAYDTIKADKLRITLKNVLSAILEAMTK